MAQAAVVDVVVTFLRLTFEFEEPREAEVEGEIVDRPVQTPCKGIPYFDHREHGVLIYAEE